MRQHSLRVHRRSTRPDCPNCTFPTNGEFPVSVAYSGVHNVACVLNSGGCLNIASFSVSKSTGLVPLPESVRTLGIQQSSPPTGLANTGSDILFNNDATQLLVSVKGDPSGKPGFIAVFAVEVEGCNFALARTGVRVTPDNGVCHVVSLLFPVRRRWC
jgi:hypothetical protein